MTRRHNKMSSVGDIDPHAAVFHLRRESRLEDVAIQLLLAASDVELPAMPGAGHDTAGKLAFAERSALMRTDAVERKELSVDVEQRDNAVADDHFQRAAWRAGVNRGDFVPGHEGIK